MASCTFSIWRRAILSPTQSIRRVFANLVNARRYLATGKPIDQNKDADISGTLFTVRRRGWTSEEEGVIDRAIQRGLSWHQCVELLPSTRTPLGIQRKYRSRKRILRSQRGDEDDLSEQSKTIIKLAGSGLTASQIRFALPHLSQDKIHSIAWYHGFKLEKSKQSRGHRWSAKEDDVIRQELRNGVPDSPSLVEFLPGRTQDAIEWRACYLTKARTSIAASKRQAPWSAEEDEKAVSAYVGGVPLVKIAEMLSRTYASIQTRLSKLERKQFIIPASSKSESKC